MSIDLKIPEKLLPLFTSDKKRFAIWGGRGSGKSWTIAQKIIISAMNGLRCLCVREVATNIDGSVKTLLADTIDRLDITGFEITDKRIKHISGGYIDFKGIKGGSHAETRTKLKGLEEYKVFWFEEAEGATDTSLDIISGTFERVEDVIEIYSYNRYFRKDPVHRHLVLCNDPTVEKIKINYWDNPFIAQKMIDAAERMKKDDFDKYMWKYGGEPKSSSNLRVYYKFREDINGIEKERPYYTGVETWTMWDFGVRDPTAVAIVQIFQDPNAPNGVWINFIDEYINRNKPVEHYKKWVMNYQYFDKNWRHACDPAGANRSESLSSWVDKLEPELGMEYTFGKSIAEYVDLANEYLPSVRINENQCPQFYDMFTNWEYPEGEDGMPKEGSKPKHDVYSHPGTAFYYFIMERFNPDYQNRKYEVR